MIIDDIRGFLMDNSDVYGIVGEKISAVELSEIPQYPYITMEQISGPWTHTLGDGKRDFSPQRWQITAWASTYKSAKELAQKIAAAFDGHIGPLKSGSPPAATDLSVQAAMVIDEHDVFQPTPRVYMCPVDIEVQRVS